MKCPYCSKEMRLGQICANNLLSWTPDGESASGVTRWSKSPNSIVLAKYYVLAQASVAAYYCGERKKIVIDVANDQGEVPCLKGEEAKKAFDDLEYEEAIRFYDGYASHIDKVSVIGKVSAKAVDKDRGSDVYIVAKDFSWTYVRTYEDGRCGPYFARNIEEEANRK